MSHFHVIVRRKNSWIDFLSAVSTLIVYVLSMNVQSVRFNMLSDGDVIAVLYCISINTDMTIKHLITIPIRHSGDQG